jgi:hypothetical protein
VNRSGLADKVMELDARTSKLEKRVDAVEARPVAIIKPPLADRVAIWLVLAGVFYVAVFR